MSNVVTFRSPATEDINEILDDAFKEEYEEVILVGIKKGSITVHHSGTFSFARLLGCLEIAKYQLLAEE